MAFKLRTKLLLSLLASSILPILLVCIVVGLNVKSTSLEDFFISTGKELNHIEKAISIFIDETKANTSLLAQHPAFKRVDNTINSFIEQTEAKASADLDTGPVEQKILDLTNSLTETHKSFVAAYIGTEFGGFSMSGTDTLPPGYDPRSRPWYKEALTNKGIPLVSKAYQSTTGDVVITATQSVERNGKTVGVVGIDVTLGELTDFIETIQIGNNGYVMLVQDDGVILADPKVPDNNFKNIKELKAQAYIDLGSVEKGELIVDLHGASYAVKVLTSTNLGWKLIGLEEKSQIMAHVYSMLLTIAMIGTIIAIAFMVFGFFLANSLAKPIVETTLMIKDIAEGEGDLTKRIDIKTRDEVAELAGWFNIFLEKLQVMIKTIADNSDSVGKRSNSLSNISSSLLGSAEDANTRATSVAAAAEEMSTNLNTIAAAMEESSINTEMVSNAADDMSSTIQEIASNAERARSVSSDAVNQAENAFGNMKELGFAADKIGKVTETITEISEQTNLLALNATIEAARAGEAGKGFAVVANEIKDLAKQTAEATFDIKGLVDNVQTTSKTTEKGIEEISGVINDVNDIVATIATAVEEQTAATQEIAGNIAQASEGIQEVNENVSQSSIVASDISKDIAEIANAATSISQEGNDVKMSSQELLGRSGELNEVVGRFKV